MLRYLRKTTEKLDVKANLLQKETLNQGSVSFVGEDPDWNEELNTIEKIVRIIRTSHCTGNGTHGGNYLRSEKINRSSKIKRGNLEEVEVSKEPPSV